MASLIITIKNCKQGFDLPEILGKTTVIGSDDSCDIVLIGVDGLSRRHCTITCTEQGFMLEDTTSTYGTYVGEEEVEEAQLMKEGVVYSMGDAAMIIAELDKFNPTAPKEKPVRDEAEPGDTAPTPPKAATAAAAPTPNGSPRALTRPLAGRAPARRAKLQTGDTKKKALSDEELQQKAKLLAGSFGGSGVSTLYVVVIIILAFYAGMALYSWQSEGVPVPAFFR